MAISYYGSDISEHMSRTPEGYLICRDVPINRTGTQEYTAGELGLDGDPDRLVTVYRLEEDVFAPAALASLEGKDVTRGHPPEMLTAENHAGYSNGHMEHIRREADKTVADLIIKDPGLASDIENGILREVSCGYHCTFVPHLDGFKQVDIIGNHVAVVPRGRAGHEVAIKDAAAEAEKGRKYMSDFWKSVLTAFGMAAKDASPEELDAMVGTTASVLDADPTKVQDAEPAKEEVADEVVYKEQKGVDLGSKMDRLLELMEALTKKEEKPMSDEEDLDDLIEKLAGKGENEVSTPAGTIDAGCVSGPARDACVALLKKVRPVVAGIEDKATRARVTDALIGAIRTQDMTVAISKAATDAARVNANATNKNTYEQRCAASEDAYAALNPHKKKEV